MTPDYMVIANDRDITALIKRHLVGLDYNDSAGIESDSLTITIADDGAFRWPSKRAVIDFYLGFEGQLNYKGRFTVSELDHTGPPDQITLHATANDMTNLSRRRTTKNWSGRSIESVINEIAKKTGLIPVVSDSLKSIMHPSLYQFNESDVHFLSRIARNYGAIAKAKSGRLLFISLGYARTASGQPMPRVTIDRTNTNGHTYEERGEAEYTWAAARYIHTFRWNRRTHRRYRWVYVGDSTGARIALPDLYDGKDAANAACRAALMEMDRSASRLNLTLSAGRPSLTAESALSITGFRSRIAELDWVIDSVTHSLSGSTGLTTSLNAVRTAQLK